MPKFSYIGRVTAGEAAGQEVRGITNASTREGVAEKLMQEQIVPIKITLVKPTGLKQLLSIELTPKKVKTEEMVAFCRQMQTMIKVGISVVDALIHIANTTQSITLKRILPEIAEAISSGKSLSDSLRQYNKIFSPVFINILSAGESGGKLDYAFERLTVYLQLENKTVKQIKSAIRYPIIVLVVILAAFAVVNLFVIPSFTGVFEKVGADLPVATQILVDTSNFFVAHWIMMASIIVLILVGAFSYTRTQQGRYAWHAGILKIPIAGKILKNALLARFCRIFAMVLQTGIPLTTGFSLVADTLGNSYVVKKVNSMRTGVEQGESITKVAKKINLFPAMVMQMLAIGEQTGALDRLLIEVAEYYESEVEYDLGRLNDLIEPIMLIIMGIMVTMIAVGVFLPMWSIAGKLNQ